MSDPAVPAPRPLSAEDSDLIDRIDAWCDEWHTEHPLVAKELLYETFGVLLEVRAEVESLRTRLAATGDGLENLIRAGDFAAEELAKWGMGDIHWSSGRRQEQSVIDAVNQWWITKAAVLDTTRDTHDA